MSQTNRWRALARSPLEVLALAGVVAFLVAAIPPAVSRSLELYEQASRFEGEGATSSLERIRGKAYWEGIRAAREAIPRNGSYLLATEGAAGVDVFARFDLAPRRARYVGRVVGGRQELAIPGRPADAPPWVVVARGQGEPLRLVSTDVFFHNASDFQPGREDGQIPCNVEVPAEGETVREPVVLRGWCQERGGRPCEAVRIFLDGEERRPVHFERYPRPDVEAVVKGIGSCERAGFRAVFAPEKAGEHTAIVFFLTSDGRYRRVGPLHFVVLPPAEAR